MMGCLGWKAMDEWCVVAGLSDDVNIDTPICLAAMYGYGSWHQSSKP